MQKMNLVNVVRNGRKNVSITHKKFIRENLLSKNIIDKNTKLTYAKINNDDLHFWSNPSIKFIDEDWCLVLDDIRVKKMYVFYFPKNSIKSNVPTRVMPKSSRVCMDLQIRQNFDGIFINDRSRFVFNPYLVTTVKYKGKSHKSTTSGTATTSVAPAAC